MKTLRITTLGILLALAGIGGVFTAAMVGAHPAAAGCSQLDGDCKNQGP